MDERLSIEGLRYARAVAEASSFSAAAKAHGVTQPALSAGIARLEERLGARLFDRSPRGAVPTPSGMRLLPLIAKAVAEIDAVIAESRRMAGDDLPSEIRLGVSPLISHQLVARAFGAVRELSPPRGLAMREGNLDDLRAALIAGQLDLVIAPSVMPIPRFEHRIVGSEPVMIVDPGLAGEPSVELDQVADHEFILVPDECGLTRFTKQLLSRDDRPLRIYPGEASSCSVLESWSTLGLAAAVLPESKIASSATPRTPLLDHGTPVEIFYAAIWSPSSALAPDLATVARLLGATEA